jgi:hypothetical protein
MRAIRGFPLPLLLGALLCPTAALAAEPDSAQALFDLGMKAMEAGRYGKACPALEASLKLDPRPGVLFTLAECEAQRGRAATATARYDEFLALYANLPPDKKAKQAEREKAARAQRAALATKIAGLTVTLPPGVPPGTIVTRDGTTLAQSDLGVSIPVDPGEHVLAAKAPDGTVTETRVTLGAGEKKALTLAMRGAGAGSEAEAEAAAAGPSKVVIGVGAALGVAAIAVGGVVALAAGKAFSIGKLQTEIVATGGCATKTSPGACADLRDALGSQATLRNVGLGAVIGGGAIGIATLVYGLAAGRSASGGKTGLVVVPVATGEGGGVLVRGVF